MTEWVGDDRKKMIQANSITVSIGVTKNTGNYESVRLDASVTLVDEDPNDPKSWDKAWKLVDDELSEKVKELEG